MPVKISCMWRKLVLSFMVSNSKARAEVDTLHKGRDYELEPKNQEQHLVLLALLFICCF